MIAVVGSESFGYDDVGSGIPLVFLHAFPLNRQMWAPQTSGLVTHARCIAPDLRGFGESTSSPPFTMDRMADDVAALLDALHVDRAVICGASWGGYMAFALWRRHRSRVRAFVLADTRATADSPEVIERRRSLIELARTTGVAAVAARQIGVLVSDTTRLRQRDTCDGIYSILAAASVEGIVGGLEAMIHRPDSTPTLPSIDVPTLIVVGDGDTISTIDDARAMARAIRGSRVEVISQAGHLPNMERPGAFNAVVSEFLGSLRYN